MSKMTMKLMNLTSQLKFECEVYLLNYIIKIKINQKPKLALEVFKNLETASFFKIPIYSPGCTTDLSSV